MSKELTYRLYQPDDLGGVLRLWAEESGWGGITEEQFNKWFDTPFGRCLISVAVNENGKILGQQMFMPSKFYLEGAEEKACRVLAPILSKEIRGHIRRKNHPFYEMHRVCLQAARAENVRLIYAFPLHSWIGVMKLFPKVGLPKMEIAEYECWTLRKTVFEHFSALADELETLPVTEFSTDFAEIWDSAKDSFPIRCGMLRAPERLRWKLGGHLVFSTRNKRGKLVGYLAINRKTGLIVDMLAVSPDHLKTVLASSLQALRRFEVAHGALAFGGLGLMKTEVCSSLIEDFGFEKTDFKFAFGCYSTDSVVSTESIRPENWYKMPDD